MSKIRSKVFYGWFVVLGTFLCTFASGGLVVYSFSLFVVPMSDSLDVPRTAVAGAVSLFTICMGLMSTLVGVQVAKGRVRQLIVVGAALMAGGYVTLSVTDSLGPFYLSYVLLGIGSACTGPVLNSSVATAWFDRRRGLAVGISSCGASVCAIVVPYLLVLVMESAGLRAAYLACAALVVVLMTVAYLLIRSRPEDIGLLPDGRSHAEVAAMPIGNRPAVTGLTLGQAVRTPALWILCAAFAMLGFSQMGVMQNAAPYLDDLRFDSQTAATALGFIGLAGVISTVASGWLADRNPKLVFFMGNLLLLLGTVVLIHTRPESGLAWLTAYAVMFGLGMGVWASALPLIVTDLMGVKYFGAIWGIAFAAKSLGGDSTGVPVVSGIAEASSYQAGFWVAVVLLVVSAALVLLARKPQTPTRNEPAAKTEVENNSLDGEIISSR